MSNAPQPNPRTVEALLDTTWHVATAETGRTDAIDRKASTLATALILFCSGLAVLVVSVALAVFALLPPQYVPLGTAYIRRFPTWGEVLKPPEQVQGDTMRTLVEAVARERRVNDRKADTVRWAFVALLLGLVLIAGEAGILVTRSVLE